MRNRSQAKSLFDKGKYIRFAGIIIAAGLILSLFGNVVAIRQAHDKISEAEMRVNELQEEHDDLAKQLEIVESDEYVESQLRDKLGMAREGEIILVLPSNDVLRKLAPSYKTTEPQLPDPNWKKWMELFM